ncbi:MAG TPA: hypothetical protein DEO85_08620 [Maritimibacter sp.]|nr:hypothetical protein [Maritimibacter sp.]
MKKLITLMVAGMPATALAHPGHPELSGAMGHDASHILIGGALATALVLAATAVRRALKDRKD